MKAKKVAKCGDYALDEVVSALQKEVRRGFHERAFYWAVTMVENGYENYMWRRLMVILAEDVGPLDLSVACDKAPSGLQEMLRGISSQAALDFSLDLVEIEPHIRNGEGDIFFVPRARLTTEVVGRTVVAVKYQQGESKPGVSVKTSTVDEMEQNLLNAKAGGSRPGRSWSDDEVRSSFESDETPAILSLIFVPAKRGRKGFSDDPAH